MSEIMPPGDNLKHYCNAVHTVHYVHNFISSALSFELMRDKMQLCNITSIALPPKVFCNTCNEAQ